jgi:hypothetical protein
VVLATAGGVVVTAAGVPVPLAAGVGSVTEAVGTVDFLRSRRLLADVEDLLARRGAALAWKLRRGCASTTVVRRGSSVQTIERRSFWIRSDMSFVLPRARRAAGFARLAGSRWARR